MTMLFNVTDAIGPAPDHGITRTERRLALALRGRDDVQFVVARNGRLWAVDADQIVAHLDRRTAGRQPTVERFGVDTVQRTSRRAALGRWPALLVRGADRADALQLEPFRAQRDHTLVSVGLDWIHGIPALAERHVFGTGGRFVAMCYDLIPIDHPEWLFPHDPDGFRRYLAQVVRVASRVLCISECTQRDLLRHFPQLGEYRAPVIRLGADAAVTAGAEEDAFATSLFRGEPYAVYCATVDRRKNHQLLYRVMCEMVREGLPGNIAFIGRLGSGTDDLIDCLRHDRSIAGRIAHVTDCDDAHLAGLYRHAACAVYPSLYEGWGLGVTEALAHGKPCLVARGSSLGEAGLGVCPELPALRTRPWVEALAHYLSEPPVLPTVEVPTWGDAARQLLEVVRA